MTGILRNLGHALGAGNIAQRLGDKRGVAIGLLQARLLTKIIHERVPTPAH